VRFVLFPIDVNAINRIINIVFVRLHPHINAKYILQLHNKCIIIINDHANIRPIRTGIKCIDRPITEHAGWSTLTIRCNNVREMWPCGLGERLWTADDASVDSSPPLLTQC